MSDFNNAKDRPEDFDDFDASQQAEDVYNEEDEYQDGYEDDREDNLTDAEADAMTLRDAGMGTDEDYGYYGDDGFYGDDF